MIPFFAKRHWHLIQLPDYPGTQARFPDDQVIGTVPTGYAEHFTQESLYRPAPRTEAELLEYYEYGMPAEVHVLLAEARAANGVLAFIHSTKTI